MSVQVEAKPLYFAWVNKPLTVQPDTWKLNISFFTSFSKDGTKHFGLTRAPISYSSRSGLSIYRGFKGGEFFAGLSSIFSTNRLKNAQVPGSWPDMSSKDAFYVIDVGMGYQLFPCMALKGTISWGLTDFTRTGTAFSLELPFKVILFPGMLNIHGFAGTLLGTQDHTTDIGGAVGFTFSLLPEILLSQDVVVNLGVQPKRGLTSSYVTSLGYAFERGIDLMISYSYSNQRHGLYLGTSVYF